MTKTASLKNRMAFGAKRINMDDEIYQLRRRVLDIIYQCKKVVPNLPRIEVRIVDLKGKATMGYAYMGQKVVHIDKDEANKASERLLVLVLHEVLHAVLATPHIESCKLMSGQYVPMTTQDAWNVFKSYFR